LALGADFGWSSLVKVLTIAQLNGLLKARAIVETLSGQGLLSRLSVLVSLILWFTVRCSE
jgi:hypothetical protein